MQPMAATKVSGWMDELSARPSPDSERVREILVEIVAAINNPRFDAMAGAFTAKGIAHALLGEEEKSLSAHRNACMYGKGVYGHAFNMGITQRVLNKLGDSLDTHAAVLEMPGGYNARVLSSLAVTLARLGEFEEAQKAVAEAIALTQPSDVVGLHGLARECAAIGLYSLATDLLASSVCAAQRRPRGDARAAEVLGSAPELVTGWLRAEEDLAYAVGMTVEWAKAVPDLRGPAASVPRRPNVGSPDADEVFEATRGSRARANAAVIGERHE